MDTTLLVHFFGKKGKAELTFDDFYRYWNGKENMLMLKLIPNDVSVRSLRPLKATKLAGEGVNFDCDSIIFTHHFFEGLFHQHLCKTHI